MTRPFCASDYETSALMTRRRHRWSDWMRRRFNDRERFLVACVFCGLLCGLMAVVFHLGIEHTFHAVWTAATGQVETWKFVAIMLAAPAMGGLICGLAIRFVVPGAVGSGIPQTKDAYYNRGGFIPATTGLWRVVLGTVYVGLGNALGREGPIVHASSAIASRLGRFFFKDPERIRAMIPVGMAAGIGAAFNAPLSAITFVFEELLDNFSTKAIGGIIVAVVIASVVSRTLLGEEPVIAHHLSRHYDTAGWMLVALPLGLVAGCLGHLFVGSVLSLRRWVKNRTWLRSWYAPALGGLLCGVFGLLTWSLTGAMGSAQNGVFSIGYDSLEAAFENQLVVGILVTLLTFKIIAVVVNYASGGSGGLFSPTLFIGGMLGGVAGVLLVELSRFWPMLGGVDESQIIGGCVLLGMGAMFGSVIRCPFTSLIIIFEMTGNYSLILPLMGGNVLSWAIARQLRPMPIYDALLHDDGISLKRMSSYRGTQDYRNLPVSAIMSHDVVSVQLSKTAGENLEAIHRSGFRHSHYPVVDAEGLLQGMITHRQLQEAGSGKLLSDSLSGELEPQKEHLEIRVHPKDSIRVTQKLMQLKKIQHVPVVSVLDGHRLLGIVSAKDIARQKNASEI
ncbi:chloride channel protein [Verrucomicrobiaceae bacterium N1E253]|uniref:Chloride channel protein n=1 Tax=Oceaniferula marina TaxID=2748318 RepID=A0A851GTG5_9BACT|nr:chloride channel protein [Oceaniferula marina]NWK57584.1 chloride channel protein [Oceaniferula marina]